MKAWLKGGLIFIIVFLILRFIGSLGYILESEVHNLTDILKSFFYDYRNLDGVIEFLLISLVSFILGVVVFIIFNHKKFPLYLRLGLIFISFYLVQELNPDFSFIRLINSINIIYLKILNIFYPSFLGEFISSVLLFFIVGAIIGLIISKIKSKSNNNIKK